MSYYGPQGGDPSFGAASTAASASASAAAAAAAAAGKSITPKPEHIDYSKIFVGGLSWSSTEETLKAYFEQFGPVVNVEIMKDRNTGNPRGFCFIVFSEDDTVEKIMQYGKHTVDDKIVDVKRAQARGVAPPSIHREQHPPVAPIVPAVKLEGTNGQAAANNVLSPEQSMNKLFVGGLHLAVDNEEMKR